MSHTWPLRLRVTSSSGHIAGRAEFTEVDDEIAFDIDFGLAEIHGSLDEDEARKLRDWLSWWLGETTEPEETT